MRGSIRMNPIFYLGFLWLALVLPACSWYHEFYEDSLVVEKNPALFDAKNKLVENIGIEKKGGLMHIILKKGSKTPCAEALVLSTRADKSEKTLSFRLYRGLSEKISGDVLLGEFQVQNKNQSLAPGTQVHLSVGTGEGKILLEAKNLQSGERMMIFRKNIEDKNQNTGDRSQKTE